MTEKDEVNVVQMLIDLKSDVSEVKADVKNLKKQNERMDNALKLIDKHDEQIKNNTDDINDIKDSTKWLSRTMWVAILLPLILMLIEKTLRLF